MDVYVTRDTYTHCVRVWPATVGIRKFPGCEEYGAAWSKGFRASRLSPHDDKWVELLSKTGCYNRFGFYPKEEEAWLIEGKKKTQIFLLFSP